MRYLENIIIPISQEMYRLDNLYICKLKSNLCLYPNGKTYSSKILHCHAQKLIDPLNGDVYEYDEVYQIYTNLKKDLYVSLISRQLSKIKYVTDRYSLYISKEEIKKISEKFV